MEAVRYRPGEAARWLGTGADSRKRTAKARGRAVLAHATELKPKAITKNVTNAAGALLDLGKSAYAELLKRKADAFEYVLRDDALTVENGSSSKEIRYDKVGHILLGRDKATLTVGDDSIVIKPYAHIVAGRVRVPIGWDRNGMDVPFELLIEEIAARCRLTIEEEE